MHTRCSPLEPVGYRYSDATQCSGRGKVDSGGNCVCDKGFVGASCQHSNATTCNGP